VPDWPQQGRAAASPSPPAADQRLNEGRTPAPLPGVGAPFNRNRVEHMRQINRHLRMSNM
jgi:hypothetical protein